MQVMKRQKHWADSLINEDMRVAPVIVNDDRYRNSKIIVVQNVYERSLCSR